MAAPKRGVTKKAKVTAKPKAKNAPAARHGQRKDFGTSIDSFFDKQPPNLRAILVELRAIVEKTAPDASSSIKWGMPFYELGGKMFAALGAHKAHVNLILWGPPSAFADPKGRLTGDAKMGRHLKLTDVADLPRADVSRWVKTAAELSRAR